MKTTNQKSIIDTQQQKQQPKYITIDRHPITREENKKGREEK